MLKFSHSQMGAQNDVVTLFAQMQKSGFWPDVFVYPSLIKSVGNEGIVLHAHVLKLGFGCDKYVRNAMIDMYAKCGPIEVARQVILTHSPTLPHAQSATNKNKNKKVL